MAPTLPKMTRRRALPLPPPPSAPTHGRAKKRKVKDDAPPTAEAMKGAPPAATPMRPAKKRKVPAPEPAKKPPLFQRTWHPGDEVRILEALAAHRRYHGNVPTAALGGRLDKELVTKREVCDKQRRLQRCYVRDARKAAPPADDHERRLYFLSRDVWGDDKSAGELASKDDVAVQVVKSAGELAGKDAAAQVMKSAGELAGKDAAAQVMKSAGELAGKDAADQVTKSAGELAKNTGEHAPKKATTLGEMRELYPCLVHEAELLVDPAVLETLLTSIDDDKAQKLEKKINKTRRRLVKAIAESARMKNMEIPTACLCPSTKLQPEKLREENGNNLLLECFDKTDGICAQDRLAWVEREIADLRRIVIASQSQAKIERNWRLDKSSTKGIRCESAESALQSIVAENQIPLNILQNKIEAPNSLPCGKNKEITSEHFYDPPGNNKLQRMLLPTKKWVRGRKSKIGAESQTPRHAIEELKVTANVQQDFCHDKNVEGGKEVVLLSIARSHGPVAKAILETSSQSETVGDMRLGTQCCKVFVNDVLQTEAPLLHEFGDMKKMFHALNRSIPWPRQQIQHITAAGMAAPHQEEIGSKDAEGRREANHKVPSPSVPKKKLQGQKRRELSLEDACIRYVQACNKSCPNTTLVKFGKYHTVLRASDLRPLTVGPSHDDRMKYLTDRLMDARGQQMMDAHAKLAKQGSDNSFFIVGSILWEFLLTSPKEISNKEDYFNLAWDMTYNDLVFIPLLVKQDSMEHWILFVVNNKRQEFQILDSLWDMSVYEEKINDTKNIVNNLRAMLSNDVPDVTPWQIRQYHDIPQQSDGWSCGLYVLKYMELWNGTSLRNFTQDGIYNFRRSLPAEFIFSKLNTLVNVKREIMDLQRRMKISQV